MKYFVSSFVNLIIRIFESSFSVNVYFLSKIENIQKTNNKIGEIVYNLRKDYGYIPVIAKAIKTDEGTFKQRNLEELKRNILIEVDGGTDDRYLRYADVCDRISNIIDTYIKAESEE